MFRHVGMNDKKVLLKRFMSRQQFHYFTTILLRCLSLYFCGLIILVPHKSNLIRLKEKRIQLLKSSSFIDYQEHRKLFCNPRDFIKILYVISYTNGREINSGTKVRKKLANVVPWQLTQYCIYSTRK